jgi:hypothetical protein
MHLLHLLKLIGGKDRGELLLGGLVERLHLLVSCLLRELAVASDGLHLLIAVGEDRFKLGGLVWSEVQHLGEVLYLTLGAALAMMPLSAGAGVAIRTGGGLLRECCTGTESKCESRCDEGAARGIHRVGSFAFLKQVRVAPLACKHKHQVAGMSRCYLGHGLYWKMV